MDNKDNQKDKKLSQWAKDNKKSYISAYRAFEKGEIKGSYKTAKGSIFVKDVIQETIDNIYDNPTLTLKDTAFAETKSRRNRAAVGEDPEMFSNIENGMTPFQVDGSYLSVKQAAYLCQKAYWNFDVFRNTIDLMTEFSVTNITFRGGSKKSKDLFTAIFKKIGLWNLQDMYYRENFRSGNTFIYRFEVEVDRKDVAKLTQVFADDKNIEDKINDIKSLLPKGPVNLPCKYIILNPADIRAGGCIDFSIPQYYKYLTPYEVNRLKLAAQGKEDTGFAEEDKEVFDSLDSTIQQQILSGSNSVIIPLDLGKLYASFYKKQSYEPFSVPMGYPVLQNLNSKAELRKMDNAIARTTQQAILLITLGYESKDGKYQYPVKVAQAIQEMFSNESVGRVLVADFTAKAEFVIPQIGEILNPQKYEVLDRDINIGLNNILVSGEKFSNQAMKVQVFVERLRHAREQFKNDFLLPEIKRIAKELGLKNYPYPYFEEINLKDELEFSKIYTQLVSIGVLTPEEGINAIETGTLPNPEESLESQLKFKDYKQQQLYQPLIGGGVGDQMQLAKQSSDMKLQQTKIKQNNKGRPTGTKSKKKVTPVGGSFSLSKLKENINLAAEVYEKIEQKLKTKDEKVVSGILESITSNELPENWKSSVAKYIKNPIGENNKLKDEIEEIAYEHQTSYLVSSLLNHSKKTDAIQE